jgi:pyocin large subunit-like protein
MDTRSWALRPLKSCLLTGGAAALLIITLAACDGAPSATAARSHSGGSDRRLADSGPPSDDSRAPAQYRPAVYTTGGETSAPREAAPLFHGKPMWASNKKHSAQENADYHFKRDGEDLVAKNEDDYLTKVHAFVDAPPKGTESLTRSNGDKLMYDAKSNLFAVVDRDGAPRTLFKPRNGPSYWDQQKQTLADDESGDRRTGKRKSARRSSSDDNG